MRGARQPFHGAQGVIDAHHFSGKLGFKIRKTFCLRLVENTDCAFFQRLGDKIMPIAVLA
jgi:hypothetical protein